VGQELKANLINDHKLAYWVREKKQSQAEVDFIITHKGNIIPLETKAGKEGKLRSLRLFMDLSNDKIAIRFYAGKFQKQEIKMNSNKKFTLLNLPYYQVGKIEEYLDSFC